MSKRTLALFITSAIVLIAAVCWKVMMDLGLWNIPFDPVQWRTQSHPAAMVSDLVQSKRLIGLTEQQVDRLLGPDEHAFAVLKSLNPKSSQDLKDNTVDERTMSYKVKGVLMEFLTVTLKKGKVVRVDVYFG
jgi:hypothetical protein